MQQRNLRNEIMIAVGAVLIIGFGLLFAVLLTGNPEESNATDVAQVVSPTIPADETEATTEAMTATEVSTEEATTESVTATEVASASPEPSTTEAATNTVEASPTVAASATDLPTSTDKATESSTANATNEISDTTALSTTGRLATTAAATANQITATNTAPIATERASATNEPNASADASPTTRNTGRATRAVTSTAESTATATNTRRPSATPSNTPSPTRTTRPSVTPLPTLTLRPTATPTSQNAMTGIIPTPPPSPTVPPLSLPTRTPSSCQLPQGWTTYTVLSGNTLFAIALATNSTVDELRTANCIENIDNIQTGDVVFVPRAPLSPVATFVNTGSRAGLGPIGCQSPNVQITSPISNQRLNGTFTIFGSAIRSDFLYYKIEVRPDAASIYNFYSDSRNQVTNGVLGEINSELFGSGLHWLKLTLVDLSASIPADATCEIPVIFE